MPCEADPTRPRYGNPGWTCTGDNLVIVLWHHDMPIVIPEALLPEVLATPMAHVYKPEPYTGGDHYHLVRPAGSRPRKALIMAQSPRVFGRDPALLLALGASAVKLTGAFLINLSVNEQATLNALVAALVGFAVARVVRDGQVAAILGILQALIAVAIGFGLRLSPESQALIMTFAGTVAAMFTRTQVTAPVPPAPQ